MKQKLLTNYLKISFSILGALTLLFSCQGESFEDIEPELVIKKVTTTDFNSIKALNSTLAKYSNNTNIHSRSSNATNDFFEFTVVTEQAKYIEKGDYHSYTFPIIRDNPDDNIQENLLLDLQPDGSYSEYLVRYHISQEEFEQIESNQTDIHNVTVEFIPIDDTENIIYSRRSSGCQITYNIVVQFSYNDDCTCVFAAVSMENVQFIGNCGGSGGGGSSSGGGSTDNGNNTGGGGGSGGGTGSPYDNTITSPINLDGSIIKDPCKNTRELLAQYPEYRQKLIALAQTVNEDHENAVGIYKDGTEFEESGNSGQPNVNMNVNPYSKYIAIAHTHYETSTTSEEDTYSIFSIEDLEFFSQRLRENKLDHSKFVAFLITGKGTRYALTINNKSKFLDFFKYVEINRKWNNGQASTPEETNFVINTIVPIYDKYYDDLLPTPAPIKKENTDNQEVLEAFLQFMDEANMGVSLFSIDETFTNYTKLNYDTSEPNNIKETPCN